MMPILISLLLFGAIALAGLAVFGWTQQSTEERDAVRTRLRRVTKNPEHATGVKLLRDERLSNIPLLNALLLRTPVILPLVRMIRQAGMQRRVGEVILYIPLLFFIGILFPLLFGMSGLVSLGVGLFLAFAPIMLISRARRKRLLLFREQLPEALDLVRSALQAGHGLIASMAVAGETLPDPVATEFRYVVDETRLGLSLRDALYHLSARVGDPNLPILIVGILVAQEVGGNLTEVVDNTAYTIRERAKLQRDIRTLTAQSRMSAVVLTLLPILVGAFMYVFNPTYFEPMIVHEMGPWLLAYAAGFLILGNFTIRRIIRSAT
jgi:tight adherence protein B